LELKKGEKRKKKSVLDEMISHGKGKL